jgi:hypothetical protein
MEIKEFVLEKINSFLFSGKNTVHQIRVILNHFRFVYRYIYRDLLDKIIKTSKNELRKILEAIPELLPIETEFIKKNENHQDFLYHGVWHQISEE